MVTSARQLTCANWMRTGSRCVDVTVSVRWSSPPSADPTAERTRTTVSCASRRVKNANRSVFSSEESAAQVTLYSIRFPVPCRNCKICHYKKSVPV